jgi:hypothetical protein
LIIVGSCAIGSGDTAEAEEGVGVAMALSAAWAADAHDRVPSTIPAVKILAATANRDLRIRVLLRLRGTAQLQRRIKQHRGSSRFVVMGSGRVGET